MGFTKLKRPILGRFVYIVSEQSVISTFIKKTLAQFCDLPILRLHRHRRQATDFKVRD